MKGSCGRRSTSVGEGTGSLDDHAAREVFPQVVEEFSGGARTVRQLQLLEVSQLDETGQAAGGQQGTTCNSESQPEILEKREF